jgi:hypothetical protein
VGRLRQWQQQVPSLQQALSATAATPQLQPPLRRLLPANTQLLPQEFGSNLDVKVLEGPAAMSWFIPASSSTAASRRQQQQQVAAMAGGAATPAELRQVCMLCAFWFDPAQAFCVPHASDVCTGSQDAKTVTAKT